MRTGRAGRIPGLSAGVALFLVRSLVAPVLLLDRLDFFLAEAEIVPDLVNQRLADDDANLVLVLAVFLDRALKERDAIGQRVAEPPGPLRQRGALVEPVQRIGRLDLHFLEQLRARFILHHERKVLHLAAEFRRDEFHRFGDELYERGASHRFREGTGAFAASRPWRTRPRAR